MLQQSCLSVCYAHDPCRNGLKCHQFFLWYHNHSGFIPNMEKNPTGLPLAGPFNTGGVLTVPRLNVRAISKLFVHCERKVTCIITAFSQVKRIKIFVFYWEKNYLMVQCTLVNLMLVRGS